jgi:uncharacterized protein DUF6894
MPMFHFHTDDLHDDDGHVLPNVNSAKCEAIKLAAQMICDQADDFWDRAEWSMTVTDERGLTLFQLQVIGTESPAIDGASARRSARRSA